MLTAGLISTLGNMDWVRANIHKIQACLPQTWTHMDNIDLIKFGASLKSIGILWTDYNQLSSILILFDRTKIILRENKLIKINPNFDIDMWDT